MTLIYCHANYCQTNQISIVSKGGMLAVDLALPLNKTAIKDRNVIEFAAFINMKADFFRFTKTVA